VASILRPHLPRVRFLAAAALASLLACDGGTGTGPEAAAEPGRLEFGDASVHLTFEREGEAEIRNLGGRPVGPVLLEAEPVRRIPDGETVAGAELVVEPSDLATVNPGASVPITFRVRLPSRLPSGGYETGIRARSDGGELRLPVDFAVRDATEDDVASFAIEEAPEEVRQGEVARLRVSVRDAEGRPLEAAPIRWSTVPAGGAFIEHEGFVAFEPGTLRLVGEVGELADTAVVEVEPRGLSGSIQVTGTWPSPGRTTSDLWVHGDVAYTGTWARRGTRFGPGNALFVWDLSDPSKPEVVDSVLVDAGVVNDVKVSADGTLGVLTHEFASVNNGVTFLDLTDPRRPRVASRFTEGLEAGVHNAWLDGDYAYLVVDGVGNGLRILDISDPADPVVVASFWAGSSFLHDVYVRDGLAFLSHWDAGLVILDVGNGIAGGSPEAPVEVSRLPGLGGQTHNAWYWPEGDYVFVGEEDFLTPGILHVIDVEDLRNPEEVATFAVPGDTPHNFWLDEERAILYAAWYSEGIRAVDVSGELLGPLERQGREIASAVYGEPGGACPPTSVSGGTCTWAPQLHRGRLFLSDVAGGLVAATPLR